MQKKHMEAVAAVMLIVISYITAVQAGRIVSGKSMIVAGSEPVVVIDAGHGGNDPGKIGIDKSLEKDINLKIALKLKKYLESADVKVIMTRSTDKALYEPGENNKKMADMRNRCRIIEDADAALVISIHQNSYHQEYVSGPQVFYYKTSEKGKMLAEIIQKRFDYVIGSENDRNAKPNGSYYLLLHTKVPMVIAECGFLSNSKEAAALNDDEYQDKIAWTIYMGIMEYINSR